MIDLPITSAPLTGKSHLARRILAFLVDYGLFLAVARIYVGWIGIPDPVQNIVYIPWRHMLVLFAGWCCWFPVLEAVFGFTLGKGLFDLRVVTPHGLRADIVQCFQRRLLDPVDFVCCLPIPGLLAVLLTPSGQRLGDLWAKTVVVYEKELPSESPA